MPQEFMPKSTQLFLADTIELIMVNHGDPTHVYPLWYKHQNKLNNELLEQFPRWLDALFGDFQDKKAYAALSIIGNFGNLINQFDGGDPLINRELGIMAYEKALPALASSEEVIDCAYVMSNLAVAYLNRERGARTDNLKEAIQCSRAARQVFSHTSYAHEWERANSILEDSCRLMIRACNRSSIEESHLFLLWMFNFIQQHDGEIDPCKQEFERHKDKFTETLLPLIAIDSTTINGDSEATRIRAGEFFVFAELILDFELGSNGLNIEISIYAFEFASQFFNPKYYPEEWAETQYFLGKAYSKRTRGQQVDNIERAILFYEKALQVWDAHSFSEDWAITNNNLASLYLSRTYGTRSDNVETAIKLARESLIVRRRREFPLEWADAQSLLCFAYQKRVEGEPTDNIEQSIASGLAASEIFKYSSHPERWAASRYTLAICYLRRMRGGDKIGDLNLALSYCKDALKIFDCENYPEDYSETHQLMASIHVAFSKLYYEKNDFREAFSYVKKGVNDAHLSVSTCSEDRSSRNWIIAYHHLAQTYVDYCRMSKNKSIQFLDKAIETCHVILKNCDTSQFLEDWALVQNTLGSAYVLKYESGDLSSLDSAIYAYESALRICNEELYPAECRAISKSLGYLKIKKQDWQEAKKAYSIAIRAHEKLYQSCIFLEGQTVELSESDYIYHHAAYTFARCGELQKAVSIAEQGCARKLRESLARDRANLESLDDPDLLNQYKRIAKQLRQFEIQQRDLMMSTDRYDLTPEALRNEAYQLRQKLTDILNQIRKKPGCQDFLALPSYESICKATTPEHPFAYLLTISTGSLTLVVTPNQIYTIWLNDFTYRQLKETLYTWLAAYENSDKNPQKWCNTIDHITRQLWVPLLERIIQTIQDLGFVQLTLIPTGHLRLLPLHAAWTSDPSRITGRQYAFDKIHITYAPNAQSLTAAREIAMRTCGNSILAINNPTQDLDNTELEIQAAIDHFAKSTVLKHGAATIAQAKLQLLSQIEIAHFSCHGTANLTEPLSSGLRMSDGILTLKDIFALNLADLEKDNNGLRLVILSACETGIIGIENADEAISFPTGLLQAGVAAVIASLWAVDDLSTMLLLTKFYDLWRKDNLEPSQALSQAQIWLRDSTEREIAPLLGQRTRNPDNRPFAHPYYWSAFSYTGI